MPKKSKTCPDCRQPLDQPARPVGHLGSVSVWCAYCEDSRPGYPLRRWKSPIPQDAPPEVLRDGLLALMRDYDCGQRQAARLLAVDERTLRRWVADPASDSARTAPWASVELLRRILSGSG